MENIQLFLLHKVNQDIFLLKMLRIFLTPTTINNREMFFQQVTITAHRAKLTSKTLLCNQEIVTDIQLCSLNTSSTSQKTPKTYLTPTTINNREMFFQQVTITAHRTKHTSKTLLCNQEIVTDIQLCSLNTSTTSQRTPKTYQTPTTITNREMFFQQVTSTTHRAKLTSKITLCNQETATDIQLCSTNRKQLPKLKPEQKMTKKTAVMKLIASQIMKKLRDQQLRMLLQFKKKEIMMIKLLQWQLDT